MKNIINWFAIPAIDLNRSVKFFSTIFDFEMKTERMGDTDLGFFPTDSNEGVGGHIYTTSNNKPTTDGPILYLNGGDDLQIILDRVEAAGGKIIQEKTRITPEIGYMAMFTDTEGNKLALHSPN